MTDETNQEAEKVNDNLPVFWRLILIGLVLVTHLFGLPNAFMQQDAAQEIAAAEEMDPSVLPQANGGNTEGSEGETGSSDVPEESDELFHARLNLYVTKGPGCGTTREQDRAYLLEEAPKLMNRVWEKNVEGHLITLDEALQQYDAGTLDDKAVIKLPFDPYAYVMGTSFKGFEALHRQYDTSMAEVKGLVTHTCTHASKEKHPDGTKVAQDCYGDALMLPLMDTVLTEVEDASGVCVNGSWYFRDAILQAVIRARSEAVCLDHPVKYISGNVLAHVGKSAGKKIRKMKRNAKHCGMGSLLTKEGRKACAKEVCPVAVGSIAARPYLSCHAGGGCIDFNNASYINKRLEKKNDSIEKHGMGGGNLVQDKRHRKLEKKAK